MTAPALVAHADWSMHAAKRWIARAVLRPEGYLALPPAPVGPLESFWAGLAAAAGPGPIVVGFDFPIGLPAAYAARAGITDFLCALDRFGDEFYEPAGTPAEIALTRPFYPHRPGGCSRRQLLDGLGLTAWQHLHRRCDRATAERLAACPMFWTLGANQVGRAAITGWRHLLAPARREGLDLGIWPFEGSLDHLLARRRFVVAETYPGEVYGHLGLELRSHGGKRRQAARRANAARLLAWAEDAKVALAPGMRTAITTGFGNDPGADDRFDAAVGLFGLLNVLCGRRPSGEPDEATIRRIEGWILGLDPAAADRGVPSAGTHPEGDKSREGVL
jgi:hypothetical protein